MFNYKLAPLQWTSQMAHSGYMVYQHNDIGCAECGAIYKAMLNLLPDVIDAEQIRNVLRKACDKAGSQANWAKQNGISKSYISDILCGKRDVSAEVAFLIGYCRKIVYVNNFIHIDIDTQVEKP